MTISSNPPSRRWTREESIIVFSLYLRIPFKDSKKSHPEVRHFSRLVNRTPDAVNMKIGNFGSLDPELKKRGIRGLRNASSLDKAVWDEFQNDWEACIEESEQLIADRENAIGILSQSVSAGEKGGVDKMSVRKVRENQDVFRMAILSAYEGKCCVTSIDIESLLVASHIKPWAKSDKAERLNPQNGLCLNALHDRAFDRGAISLSDDYSILVSNRVFQSTNPAVQKFLLDYGGKKINLPSRFLPRHDFLAWHRDNVFLR